MALPDFTRDAVLPISGRVPSFAMAPGRSVEIVLNAAVIANAELDPTGTFAASLTLKDPVRRHRPPTLLSHGEAIHRSAYTVTLDRQPPHPRRAPDPPATRGRRAERRGAGEGRGRRDRDRQWAHDRARTRDCSFSESFTPPAGPVDITVVARDRAGNETTAKSTVTLRAPTTAATW